MSWYTRFTRFGDAHLVYAQEAENSCGIACVMMVTFKINKLKLGAQAVYAEKEIYTKYGAASGANYDGSAYTYTNHLATVLNTLGIGTWTQEFTNDVSSSIINSVGTDIVGAGQVFNSIRRGYPIIVLVGWNAGGAHFVVVDTVNNFLGSTYASVCDPWDGDVHITPIEAGQPFVYEGAASPFSWDLGGTRHDYSQSQPGAANGWIVRRL